MNSSSCFARNYEVADLAGENRKRRRLDTEGMDLLSLVWCQWLKAKLEEETTAARGPMEKKKTLMAMHMLQPLWRKKGK
jgi:hypothetical protein